MCDAQTERGFDYFHEESIEKELVCSICRDPYIDPVIIPACRHTFCRSGIRRVLRNQPACPLCRHEPILDGELRSAEHDLQHHLNELLVCCQTCNQTSIKRKDFEEHIRSTCPKAAVLCTAAELRCPWSGLRDQLDQHLTICRFNAARDILEPWIAMKKHHDELQHQNAILTSHVKALNYRCEQLDVNAQLSLPGASHRTLLFS